MNLFNEIFKKQKLNLSQILLTLEDTEIRRRAINAKRTFDNLFGLGFIPLVNENDSIATSEIKYGDNDRLASRVAQISGSDCLILLSDVDGLYTDNPKKNKTTKTNSKQTTKKKTKQPKEDEKALKAYWNHIRCIPSIMKLNNIDSIDKLLNWSDWKSWIKISKSTFSWNYYNKEVFKEQVDALVRNKKDETEDFHRDRIDEYALYV